TSSRAQRYLVVRDLDEAAYVCAYILGRGNREEFMRKFAKAVSPGFDPDKDLERIGIANQTTMLSTESMEIAQRFRGAFVQRYGEAETQARFRTQDTICSSTQDRQDAVNDLLQAPPDVMIVIGGYNSSNTTHLVEISRQKCPAYHIDDAACMISRGQIRHFSAAAKREVIHENWWPSKTPLTVAVTAGASTPDNKIGDVVLRLFELAGENVADLVAEAEARG
ncbi:MAG: 4-hydroxy-3-methylbut-2-enyl diphosphate reductase, partial [Planctomycetota bacterium]